MRLNRLMRTIEASGDIYEYLDEDWQSQGYGRITLIYNEVGLTYQTYVWGGTQVTVEDYAGEYAPAPNGAIYSDVVLAERTVVAATYAKN